MWVWCLHWVARREEGVEGKRWAKSKRVQMADTTIGQGQAPGLLHLHLTTKKDEVSSVLFKGRPTIWFI